MVHGVQILVPGRAIPLKGISCLAIGRTPRQPAHSDKPAATFARTPAAAAQVIAAIRQTIAAFEKMPATSARLPAAPDKMPAATDQPVAAVDKISAASDQPIATSDKPFAARPTKRLPHLRKPLFHSYLAFLPPFSPSP
jgi:demethylmenaquinone methyltransferase/2-methoxy-6-polyprenyl-1,4-benzoquinol methylase